MENKINVMHFLNYGILKLHGKIIEFNPVESLQFTGLLNFTYLWAMQPLMMFWLTFILQLKAFN